VLYSIILVLALVLIGFLIKNLIPSVGDFISASLRKISCDFFKMC
jgi:hypothetical protein